VALLRRRHPQAREQAPQPLEQRSVAIEALPGLQVEQLPPVVALRESLDRLGPEREVLAEVEQRLRAARARCRRRSRSPANSATRRYHAPRTI
jgi:hypothetical protein